MSGNVQPVESIGPNEAEVLAGGIGVGVRFGNGTTDTVTVRILKVREYQKLADVLTDECAQVELYCDKPAGWADSLSIDAHERIIEEGRRLNSGPFGRWHQRQRQLQERLMPGFAERMAERAVASRIGSSKPQPASA